MHEIGVMINLVKTVENFAKENSITDIQILVIQIGELSSVIPRFARACYPPAVHGTMLEDTELEIEIIPGNGMCKNCKTIFNVIEYNEKCPNCGKDQWEVLGGAKEILIKEIVAC